MEKQLIEKCINYVYDGVNRIIYDKEAETNRFTKRLVSLVRTIRRKNLLDDEIFEIHLSYDKFVQNFNTKEKIQFMGIPIFPSKTWIEPIYRKIGTETIDNGANHLFESGKNSIAIFSFHDGSYELGMY